MCKSCFFQYTKKPVVNERVIDAYNFLADKDTDVGNLHVIVSDMNVDDAAIERAMDYIINAEDWEKQGYDMLVPMSEPERATVTGMLWGFISPEGKMLEE